ncbi:MAG: hypothetical protein Q9201_007076 [Fulgogasparrea decipioides]
MTANGSESARKPLTVAIVGGGIGGIALAIGLLHRGIRFHIYEASSAHEEIGAGIGFGPNSIQAMQLINPALGTVFEQLATKNEAPEEETWFNFRNGFGNLSEIAKVRTTDERKTGLSSVHRAHFLNAITRLVPPDALHFAKRLLTITSEPDGALKLLFEDGSTAEADTIIGCDGIRSRVRQLLLGEASPTECCEFSGRYAFRGLVPMVKAKSVIGDKLARNSNMYLGPGRTVVTYPIDGGEMMNVAAFQTQKNGRWEHSDWVLPNKKDELLAAFADWEPQIQDLLQLMESPAIWAIFDHSPAPYYSQGRVAICGDAAHASTPHQGAGAGQAIEDALVLAELLADSRIRHSDDIPNALQAYDAVRRPRSQRVVSTSRAAGKLYGFQGPEGSNLTDIRMNLLERYRWIWEYDMIDQVEQAKSYLGRGEAVAVS